MNFEKKKVSLGQRAVALLFAMALFSCTLPAEEKSIVARVGEEVLTWDDLIASFPAQFRDSLSQKVLYSRVSEWVNNEALAQEAKRLGLDTLPENRRRIALHEQMLLADLLRQKFLAEAAQLTPAEQTELISKRIEEIKMRIPISIQPENIPFAE